MNGVSYKAKKGDLIYIGVGKTHAFQSDSEVCSYDLYIKPEFIFTKLLSDRQLQKVMPEIIQYIKDNYFKSLSLEGLAQKSFYSPSCFSRIFKELYGKTLTAYITENE